MRMPNENDIISITKKEVIYAGKKLDILAPSEVRIKEKTDEYIIIESSLGIVEVVNDSFSLHNPPKEIMIKKGEEKKLTLPMTDYFGSVIIKY